MVASVLAERNMLECVVLVCLLEIVGLKHTHFTESWARRKIIYPTVGLGYTFRHTILHKQSGVFTAGYMGTPVAQPAASLPAVLKTDLSNPCNSFLPHARLF